jgi:hypothetical protein
VPFKKEETEGSSNSVILNKLSKYGASRWDPFRHCRSILKILQAYEPVLFTRLQSLDIPPQVYGLYVSPHTLLPVSRP